MIVLSYPVDPACPITQKFGEHPEWYQKYGYPGHNGVDFGLPAGSPVRAAAEGRVMLAGADTSGYGNLVKIDHGAFFTLYAHLSEVRVRVDELVEAGEVIALSGNTGNSTGPHLHFEVRMPGQGAAGYRNGAVDPLPLLVVKQVSAVSEETVNKVARIVLGVRVRNEPDVSDPSNIVGMLPAGVVVSVCGVRTIDGNRWARLSDHLWAAMCHNGVEFLRWV